MDRGAWEATVQGVAKSPNTTEHKCMCAQRLCGISRVHDPMDCSPSGSSVHGILQAIVLEWAAISSSRGIFPTQRSNPCLLHWQVDSLLLSHQGNP